MNSLDTLVDLKVMGDERGLLVALEENREVPFDIKRVFYIYGAEKNVTRGEHSHYKTKQFLVALSGSCMVTLDDGENKLTHTLDSPSKGLLQDNMVWGSMHNFSQDCVLLVLADMPYDNSDYIRDYNLFLEEVNR